MCFCCKELESKKSQGSERKQAYLQAKADVSGQWKFNSTDLLASLQQRAAPRPKTGPDSGWDDPEQE